MWLASPHGLSTIYVWGHQSAFGGQNVTFHDYSSTTALGSRPVVALNSDIELVKKSDGIYLIDGVNYTQGDRGINKDKLKYVCRGGP